MLHTFEGAYFWENNADRSMLIYLNFSKTSKFINVLFFLIFDISFHCHPDIFSFSLPIVLWMNDENLTRKFVLFFQNFSSSFIFVKRRIFVSVYLAFCSNYLCYPGIWCKSIWRRQYCCWKKSLRKIHKISFCLSLFSFCTI